MEQKALITLRNATMDDIGNIIELLQICRLGLESYYQEDALRASLETYPRGQFVVEYEGSLVAYASSFRIGRELALKPHSWDQITGYGFAAKHDPLGEFLYGMDVCVHPDYGDMKIEKRLLHARQHLCEVEKIAGIVLCAPIPNYYRHQARYPKLQDYVEAVESKEVVEPELSLKLQQHFEILDVLENHMPSDKDSLGHAVHMVWYNPVYTAEQSRRGAIIGTMRQKELARIAIVQYLQRPIQSYDEFEQYIEFYIRAMSGQETDFALFPDLFLLQLLSIGNLPQSNENTILTLADYTESFTKLMRRLAIKYDMNIIAGSHPTKVDGKVYIVSGIFLRDGQVHQQFKLHPTTSERFSWGVHGGDKLSVIDTDCGPIAVLINYDCEFPELARLAVEEGARLIFVPFSLGRQHDYISLRYCAQARAVENHCFVVTAGNVGIVHGVPWMDVQYAQSSIFTPSGLAFSRNAIAVDIPLNVEMIAYADLNLKVLESSLAQGSVLHMKERRLDLYSLKWDGKDK